MKNSSPLDRLGSVDDYSAGMDYAGQNPECFGADDEDDYN